MLNPPGSGVLQPTLLATKQLAMSACGYISFGTSPGSDVRYLRVPPVFTGVVPPNANIQGSECKTRNRGIHEFKDAVTAFVNCWCGTTSTRLSEANKAAIEYR